jgi:hypothetical protein
MSKKKVTIIIPCSESGPHYEDAQVYDGKLSLEKIIELTPGKGIRGYLISNDQKTMQITFGASPPIKVDNGNWRGTTFKIQDELDDRYYVMLRELNIT